MTVILDQYVIPQGTGTIEINQAVTINIAAIDAQRLVRRWVTDEVAFMLTTAEPSLVVNGERSSWRVPIILTATHVGHVGEVGTVDVNVATKEIVIDDAIVKSIKDNMTRLAETVPPYQPRQVEGEAIKHVVQNYEPTPNVASERTPHEIVTSLKTSPLSS